MTYSTTTGRSPERIGSKTVMHLMEPMRKRDQDVHLNHLKTKLRFIKNFDRKSSVQETVSHIDHYRDNQKVFGRFKNHEKNKAIFRENLRVMGNISEIMTKNWSHPLKSSHSQSFK